MKPSDILITSLNTTVLWELMISTVTSEDSSDLYNSLNSEVLLRMMLIPETDFGLSITLAAKVTEVASKHTSRNVIFFMMNNFEIFEDEARKWHLHFV